MTYQEVLEQARTCMGKCHACPVCNGLACKNTVPGPGAKGLGTGAIRNYQKWQELCVNMDTICENGDVDTSYDFFGHKLTIPVMAGPVGAVAMHYSDKYDDLRYNNVLVEGCAKAGILAFTGDGTNPAVMEGAADALKANGGCGVPTVKPWNLETVRQKMDLVKAADPCAIAMDIDAAGLPFLKGLNPPAGSKTVDQLKEIAAMAGKPFILKGIMTVKGAEKALEAGAAGIVVSRHRRGFARHRRRRGRQDEGLCGRRHPLRHGRVQGSGSGCRCGAHRPPLRHRGLRRRSGGRAGLCGQASGRACGHHGHVRCSQPGRH